MCEVGNPEHIAILKQGVEAWNRWRKAHRDVTPDLTGADLAHANLSGFNLYRAQLQNADLTGASLIDAELEEASLQEVRLAGARMYRASLTHADLTCADLKDAYLDDAFMDGTVLVGADLSGANLLYAKLIGADLTRAIMHGTRLLCASLVDVCLADASVIDCHVYGVSTWRVDLSGSTQRGLRITHDGEPSQVTVDNLEVAQFVYLLLHNESLRSVVDTITSKVVLILGRFTPERKAVLDAMREELRRHNYSPVLFDFEKPASRDLTETMELLARMARFVIADLTDPMSIPHELATIVPTLRSVPVVPVIQRDGRAYSMFADFQKSYGWVLGEYRYDDQTHLLATFADHVIAPAEAKVRELRSPL